MRSNFFFFGLTILASLATSLPIENTTDPATSGPDPQAGGTQETANSGNPKPVPFPAQCPMPVPVPGPAPVPVPIPIPAPAPIPVPVPVPVPGPAPKPVPVPVPVPGPAPKPVPVPVPVPAPGPRPVPVPVPVPVPGPGSASACRCTVVFADRSAQVLPNVLVGTTVGATGKTSAGVACSAQLSVGPGCRVGDVSRSVDGCVASQECAPQ